MRHVLNGVLASFVALLFFLMLASSAQAQSLSFQLRTGDNATKTQSMIVDSNKCPTNGPTAMYVGGIVTNTSGARVSNIVATMTGLNATVYLAGQQPAAQEIGSLDPGESVGIYWFTGYSCSIGATVTSVIRLTSSSTSVNIPVALTIRSAISSNAGGAVLSSLLGPGAIVGQTVYFDAAYDFGGTDAGDEYFLQPSGSQQFNAACFRLVGTEVISSNLNAAQVGTKNTLYFRQPGAQPGNGYRITIRYSFQYLCPNGSTVARPYAVQTSGSSNIKYTGNYDGAGSISLTYPAAANPFTITKTVDSAKAFVGTPTALTYTVVIKNPSIYSSIISKIVDVLPAGTSFLSLTADSDVTALNSSSVPSSGATGTISFVGKLGQSYAIAAGGSVTLKYTVRRPTGTGSFTNSAQAFFGTATTEVAKATFEQITILSLAATKTSSVNSNPIEGSTNPKAIPGALIDYVIGVTNPNPLPIDADTIVVSDRTPTAMKLCLADVGANGSGPVKFVDEGPSSGLTYMFQSLASTTDQLDFSSDNGATWAYLPSLDTDGCDARITHVRVRPSGAFAGSGRFSLQVRYRIK